MSVVAICTDSSALFLTGVAERLGIIVVPIAIALDGDAFGEQGKTLDDFYTRLSNGAQVTTSQPSPGAFLDAYADAAAGGAREVVSIHLDARVSGTASSAELAAREATIPVTVVDTRTVSFGVGLCVRAAADALAAGATVPEAVAAARVVGAALWNVFVVHSGPAGRLPATRGWSLLEFAEGKAEPVGACDSIGDAIDAIVGRVHAEHGPVRAAVGHAAASTEAAADALAGSLASLAQVVRVERYRVGAAVGAHTGPLSFGAFWWPAA